MLSTFRPFVFISALLLASCVGTSTLVLSIDGDKTLLQPVRGWKPYGNPKDKQIRSIVLVPDTSASSGQIGSSTVSMKFDLVGLDGCVAFEKRIVSQDLEFAQKLIPADTKSELLNGKAVKVFHTENDFADYYYTCFPLRSGNSLIGALTLSKGSISIQERERLEDDFLRTLGTSK